MTPSLWSKHGVVSNGFAAIQLLSLFAAVAVANLSMNTTASATFTTTKDILVLGRRARNVGVFSVKRHLTKG